VALAGSNQRSNEVPEVVKAYIAGLIDADGSIGIYEQGENGRTPTFTVTVTIRMAESEGIELLQQYFPRKVTSTKSYNRKRLYRYRVTGAIAKEILSALLPYLRIKRNQAELAIAYFSLPLYGGVKVPDWVMEARRMFVSKSREMKQ